MKDLLTHRGNFWALAVLVFACTAQAQSQSLGAVQGTPLIGRPLEVTVPARLAPPGSGQECAQADVAYGSRRLDPSQVSAEVRRGGMGDAIVVRARAAVDEPIVTLHVRAGCQEQVTRSYSLLPQLAPADEPLAPVAARATRVAGAAPAATNVKQAVTAPAASEKAPEAAPRPAAEVVAYGVAPALQLDLRLRSRPTEDASVRKVAGLFRLALMRDPEELQRNLLQVRALESEVALLRSNAAAIQRNAAALPGPQEAPATSVRGEPVQRPFAWLAAALGLALLAVLLVRLRRNARRAARQAHAVAAGWPPSALDSELQGDMELPLPAPPAREARRAQRPPTKPTRAPAPAPVVIPATPPASVPVLHEQVQAARPMGRVEALDTVLQEAEFMGSLGLWSDAIDTLKAYVRSQEHPPAAALCELLHLCALTEDDNGLQAVGQRWQQAFGEAVPKLHEVDDPAGIEAHPALLAQVTARWPSVAAQRAIEARLFESPRPPHVSLQAWRDLLWLHRFCSTLHGADGAREAQTDVHAETPPWLRPDLAAPHDIPAHGPDTDHLDLDLAAAEGTPQAAAPAKPRNYEDMFEAVTAAEGKWLHRAT